MWYRSESVLLGGERIATRNNNPMITVKAAIDTISNLPKLRMDCTVTFRPIDNHPCRQPTAKTAARPTSHESTIPVLVNAPNKLNSSTLRTKYAATNPAACRNANRLEVSALAVWMAARIRKAPTKVRNGRRMSMDYGSDGFRVSISTQVFNPFAVRRYSSSLTMMNSLRRMQV
jgi:hypothetical protein